ncbi:hypothetical protein CROQUDRAFT_137103 [Cronartium quercuum f. sp. fusiforme G11]|uniref:Uncharacterized protein n=1 Tax=Cronartium quercuum f. sp. fusiforme G11 TaxID=708437 RepID=A0A9P6N681_9BASI|nr:hypothetical protein CROQUDRAFT_137103 [Cronartium quercuum f. sp. fusiforme G11]
MSLYPAQPINAFVTRSHPTLVRPTLKRSQSPYTSDCSEATLERKRRRTSPTCAFAKLSLSPLHSKPSLTLSNSEPPQTEPTQPLIEPNDQRMRSVYSAYDIDPNRIFVDSLGSEPSSPIEPEPEPDLRITCKLPMPRSSIILPVSDMMDHQLVLYRPPPHLAIANASNTNQQDQIQEIKETVESTEVPMEID